jgi:hypothetical protein
MDVLPHSTDIFEGEDWIGSKTREEVKIRVEVEECVEDILREVQELLFLEIQLDQEEDEKELWQHLAESGERITGTCSCCFSDYYMVEQRCADTYEVPPDYLSVTWGEEILCQSCQCDGKKCESCGVSEKLVKTHCDRNANFSLIEGTFPPQYLCTECVEIDDELFGETFTPEELNRGFLNPEDEETYRGEFEIDTEGDQGLLDDEETKTTKEMMKEVMDEMFEVSTDISENAYMKIVNKMKEVYERL